MQAYADAEGHILLQPAHRGHLFKCTRESETDGLERLQQALSLLATVQQIFNQVGAFLDHTFHDCKLSGMSACKHR